MGEPWIDPFPVHATEIDGVPTYWIDGPPPLSATLWFRVGFADETLPQLGITHLLEHLLLGEGEIRRISNGSVDDLFTRFSTSGTRDEIVGFLRALSRDIAQPPIGRLDIERRRVLAETDHDTVWTLAARARFGLHGPGVMHALQCAPVSTTATDVITWGMRYLVHGNACLTLTGSPPSGLRLALPAGGRNLSASADLIDGRMPPYSIDGFGGTIAVSMMLRDSPASRAAALLLHDSGTDQLVERRGCCYGWSAHLVDVDASSSELRIAGSVAVHEAEPARDAILDLIHHQASSPDMSVLAAALARRTRDWSMADTTEDALGYVARASMLGRQVKTREQEISQLSAVGSDDVRSTLDEGLAGAILVQPSHLAAPKGFPFIDVISWDDEPIEGREFRYWEELPLERDHRLPTLRCTNDAISMTQGASDTLTIRFRDCVLASQRRNGGLAMSRRDGNAGWIPLPLLSDGDDLLDLLTSAIPAERFATHDAEAQQWKRIETLALERLGTRCPAWIDLTKLVSDVLYPGEEVLDLADVDREGERGILAITPRRVIFVHGRREDHPGWSEWIFRDEVADASIDLDQLVVTPSSEYRAPLRARILHPIERLPIIAANVAGDHRDG